jgi:hypothetical protein
MFTHQLTLDDLPQSLGTFKPVGHVMIALADDETVDKAADALQQVGFEEESILRFGAEHGLEKMQEMIEHSSELAGFGYEITLMRRYEKLSAQGHRWMLVYAPEDDQAQQVAEVARRFHAPMAVKYHRLAVEDLI